MGDVTSSDVPPQRVKRGSREGGRGVRQASDRILTMLPGAPKAALAMIVQLRAPQSHIDLNASVLNPKVLTC